MVQVSVCIVPKIMGIEVLMRMVQVEPNVYDTREDFRIDYCVYRRARHKCCSFIQSPLCEDRRRGTVNTAGFDRLCATFTGFSSRELGF